jgi:hypothetical protein
MARPVRQWSQPGGLATGWKGSFGHPAVGRLPNGLFARDETVSSSCSSRLGSRGSSAATGILRGTGRSFASLRSNPR